MSIKRLRTIEREGGIHAHRHRSNEAILRSVERIAAIISLQSEVPLRLSGADRQILNIINRLRNDISARP